MKQHAHAPRTPVLLRAYVTTAILAALGLTLFLVPGGLGGKPLTLAVMITMATLAGARPVRIPRMRHEITATHPFIFATLVVLGPLASVLVAISGVVGAALGRRGRLPSPTRFGFNLAAVTLSTLAAGWVFRLTGGIAGLALVALMVPLVAATTAYFLANTGLVAIAISIEKSMPFFATWRNSFLYTLVSYFSGMTLAVAMLAVLDVLLPWGLLLAATLCSLMVMYYRAHAWNVQAEANSQ